MVRRGFTGGIQDVLGSYTSVQAADTTTASTTYVPFGSGTTITAAGGTKYLLWISGGVSSSDSNNRTITFELRFDGVAKGSFSAFCNVLNHAEGVSYILLVADLTSGSHTFQMYWKTSGATAQCRALTVPGEHMEAVLMEIRR